MREALRRANGSSTTATEAVVAVGNPRYTRAV
jgi:hypothetical protein